MSPKPADKEFWDYKVVDLGSLPEKNRVELMLAFCRSVESWLKSDPLNMVLVAFFSDETNPTHIKLSRHPHTCQALVYCDSSRAASTIALACYFADCFEVMFSTLAQFSFFYQLLGSIPDWLFLLR